MSSVIEVNVPYLLQNLTGGTYLTEDNGNIVGHDYDAKKAQKWVFVAGTQTGTYYVKTKDGDKELYLYIAPGDVKDGTLVVPSTTMFQWTVTSQPGIAYGIRFLPSGSPGYGVDLVNGASKNGTPVELWTAPGGYYNQVWILQDLHSA